VSTRMKKSSMKFTGGFTLIELLIVIGMLGVLIALATPSIVEWRRNVQYKEAADGLRSALRTARNNAISLNHQNRVECNPVSNRYRITQGNRAYDSTTWTTVKQGWVTVSRGLSIRTGDNTTTDLNVEFNPNGTASTSTGKISIYDGASQKYEITVAASGRIVCTRK
jgi:type IV fimbrial biogenesis protein FimT